MLRAFVAVLSGRGSTRRLSELAHVEGLGPDGGYRVVAAVDAPNAPLLTPAAKERSHEPDPA